MTRSFVIYSHLRDRNDATFKYVDIITHAFVKAGYKDKGLTNNIDIVGPDDVVITINCAFGIRALFLRPRNKLIHWFQGIEPEERMFLHGGLKGRAQYLLWSLWEGQLMRRADLALFVSEEMREHLENKHRKRQQSFIMPCFNSDFKATSFDDIGKYRKLNLVYAGSMHPWQRVDAVIAIYRELKMLDSNARLTLLTREIHEAERLCQASGVSGVEIRSVPSENIANELQQFSHGFILRDVMPINLVSTPTKLSSYMSAGVIPIFTSATPALGRIAEKTRFKFCIKPTAEPTQVAAELYQSYLSGIDKDVVRDEYQTVFFEHFNDQKYVQKLTSIVRLL